MHELFEIAKTHTHTHTYSQLVLSGESQPKTNPKRNHNPNLTATLITPLL